MRSKLESLGQEPKAVLVLDNCSAHPDESELVSEDGKIIAKFLPANVTSLIQPMDQGVIETMKRSYKKKLLRGAIIADDRGGSIVEFIKSVNMSMVIQYVSESWKEVSVTTLPKSWNKIFPSVPTESSSSKSTCTLASVLAWKGMDKDVYDSLSRVEYDPVEDEKEPMSPGGDKQTCATFYF